MDTNTIDGFSFLIGLVFGIGIMFEVLNLLPDTFGKKKSKAGETDMKKEKL